MSEQEIQTMPELPPEVQALMEAAAHKIASEENSGIPFISLKGKKFSIGDEKVGYKDDKLGLAIRCVVVAIAFDFTWYDRPYEPSAEDFNPPACFAIGGEQDELVPHATSPIPQAKSCSICAMNQFKSAANGKGKACRNGRRLLVAYVNDDGSADLDNLAILSLSPTALRGFSSYLKKVSEVKGLPIWSVVTILSFEQEQAYPQVIATFDGVLAHNMAGQSSLIEISKRLDEFQSSVSTPYDTSTFVAYEPKGSTSPEKKSKMS
jgi:hypothetical protein